ncbi:MAG: ABC transporter ATP-binding protein [Chlamydiae bacterium]|nr:ABC transporter ATP-binding protein [Chlamydiota bacterium]MBI3277679.1 ABC transporter ATP-binding protein [Chlamydiota bacterium]
MFRQYPLIQYVRSLIQFAPLRFILGCILNIFNTFLSGIGLLMLIPLLHYSGWLPEKGLNESSLDKLLTWLPQPETQLPLLITLFIFMILISATALFQYSSSQVQTRLIYDYLFFIREQLNRSVAESRWSFLLKQQLKTVEHMLTVGIQQISSLTYFSLSLVGDCIVTNVYFIFALWINLKLTLLASTCAGLLLFLLRKHKSALTGTQSFLLDRQLQAHCGYFLDGVKLAKSYNRTSHYLEHYTHLNNQLRLSQFAFYSNQRNIQLLFKLMSAVIFSFIFYIAVHFFHVSTVSMLALMMIYARLLPCVSNLQQNYLRVLNIAPVFSELCAMQSSFNKAQEERDEKNVPLPFHHTISLENVSYHYDHMAAVKSVSCEFKKNTTTAIVGPSGAGKSTLADLLLGLLIPTEGKIKVDGSSLEEPHLSSWRNLISYVPQETFLFNDTIRANLLWAALQVSDQDLWHSLRQAAAADFVTQLPNGLDTFIGERGIHLSGGERQRLAIARALLRHPKILLLDEATSSLDSQNEELIFTTLQTLHGTMTLILIAHRFSTIRAADHVLVLNQGQLVEQGIPQELFEETTSHFNRLFNQQFVMA